jgi:hypothetical protein
MASELASPQPEPTAAGADERLLGSEIPTDGLDSVPTIGLDDGTPTQEPPAPQEDAAEARARKFQGEYDRLQAKVGPLATTMDNMGLNGDQTSGLLEKLDAALRHPELGQTLLQFFQSGQVPVTRSPEELEMEELERPWGKEIDSLKNELLGAINGIQSGITTVQRSQGMNAIESHTKRFHESYPMDDAERQEFTDAMDKRIAAMSSDSGVALLQNLDWEGYRMMAIPLIEEFRPKIEARRLAQSREGKQAMATGAIGLAAQEAEAPARPAGQPLARNKQELIQQARASARRGAGIA